MLKALTRVSLFNSSPCKRDVTPLTVINTHNKNARFLGFVTCNRSHETHNLELNVYFKHQLNISLICVSTEHLVSSDAPVPALSTRLVAKKSPELVMHVCMHEHSYRSASSFHSVKLQHDADDSPRLWLDYEIMIICSVLFM